MKLREVELNETRRLIIEPKTSNSCSTSNCPSRTPAGPAALDAYRNVFNHVVGPSELGTTVLQISEFYKGYDGELRCVGPAICSLCVEMWESGHADLRKTWGTLPEVFGLRN